MTKNGLFCPEKLSQMDFKRQKNTVFAHENDVLGTYIF
jgi:hypothetical protein